MHIIFHFNYVNKSESPTTINPQLKILKQLQDIQQP